MNKLSNVRQMNEDDVRTWILNEMCAESFFLSKMGKKKHGTWEHVIFLKFGDS